MAIALVANSAKFAGDGVTSVTSSAINSTGADFLSMTAASWHSGAYSLTPSDSKSNTWGAGDRVQAAEGAAEGRVLVAGCVGPGSVGTGHTGTVTSSAGSTYINGNFTAWSGMATASATDQQDDNAEGSGSTSNTVTTPTTTQDDELVIACFSANHNTANAHVTSPANTGYTAIGVDQSADRAVYQASYKIVSAAGAQSANWTSDAIFVGSVAAIMTYKMAAAAGGDPEGRLIGGKLTRGGLLIGGVLH